ncbi:MAG: helix-turn-helix domain-containing protein [Gemmatimonadaceae bacterium]
MRRKTEPPRGILNTGAADPARGSHERYHPPADLAPFVEHFWSVTWDFRGTEPRRVETLPHPSVHMVFDRAAGATVSGVAKGKFVRMLEGEGGVFAAKFRPGGFSAFTDLPMTHLTGVTLKVGELFGPDGDAVARAVSHASDDASRLAIVEAFLRARKPARDEQADRIGDMVYDVARDRTIVKVDDLVARYATNKRTLQRLFARYVGVSPKWVIQRYRLHEAAGQLAAGTAPSQSMLALELGYSDQAHFVRDFSAVVGTTPALYAKEARMDVALVATHETALPPAGPAAAARDGDVAGRRRTR